MNGLCWHCGKPDAPVDAGGFIGPHERADSYHRYGAGAGVPCAGAFLGNAHHGLRPGEKCDHHLAITEAGCARGELDVVGQA